MYKYAKLIKINGEICLDLDALELAHINKHYNQDTVYLKKDNKIFAIYKKLISSKEVDVKRH